MPLTRGDAERKQAPIPSDKSTGTGADHKNAGAGSPNGAPSVKHSPLVSGKRSYAPDPKPVKKK